MFSSESVHDLEFEVDLAMTESLCDIPVIIIIVYPELRTWEPLPVYTDDNWPAKTEWQSVMHVAEVAIGAM